MHNFYLQKIVFLHPLTLTFYNIFTTMTNEVVSKATLLKGAHSITKYMKNEWATIWFELMYSHKDQINDFFNVISGNPNLSMNIVNVFRNEKWDWETISKNRAFDLPDMKCNLNLPWTFEKNARYVITLSKEFLQSKSLEYLIEIDKLFSFNMYLKYPELPWKLNSITLNSTLTDINNNPQIPWNWSIMHNNLLVTKEFILQHKDKPWNWYALSSHSAVSIDLLLQLPNKSWDFDELSKNLSIPIEQIFYYKILPWNIINVRVRSDLTAEYLAKINTEYPKLKNSPYFANWCDNFIATISPNFNWDSVLQTNLNDVLKHPNIPWNWNKIMPKLVNINKVAILNNPTIPWDFSALSHSCTHFDTVLHFQHENWDWNKIAWNTFYVDKTSYIETHTKFVLIASIYEDYEEIRKTITKPDNHAESVFLDDYLLKLITQY